jgi:hypothetical protein
LTSELQEALNLAHDRLYAALAECPTRPTEPRWRLAARTIGRLARRPLVWLVGFITLVLWTALGILLEN